MASCRIPATALMLAALWLMENGCDMPGYVLAPIYWINKTNNASDHFDFVSFVW